MKGLKELTEQVAALPDMQSDLNDRLERIADLLEEQNELLRATAGAGWETKG